MAIAVKDEGIETKPGDPPAGSAMALARRAAAGDSEATGKLLKSVAPRVAQVVRAVLGGGHPDLDDAVQQSLIGFVQALPAFRGDCDPAGYATVIAVRTAVAARKAKFAEETRRGEGVEADAMPGHAPSPGEVAAAHRRKEIL